MATEANKYEPTTAEKKLLVVLLKPESLTLSVTDICLQAGIARDHYYTIFKKASFVAYYKDISLDLVSAAVMPVIKSCVKEAKKGSFQHSKLILEMAQMHSDSLELTGKDGNAIEFTDTARAARLATILERGREARDRQSDK